MINTAYTNLIRTKTSVYTQMLTLTLPNAGVYDIDAYLVYTCGCDCIYQNNITYGTSKINNASDEYNTLGYFIFKVHFQVHFNNCWINSSWWYNINR